MTSPMELAEAAERFPRDYREVTGHDPRWAQVYATISPAAFETSHVVHVEVKWRGETYGEAYAIGDDESAATFRILMDRLTARLDKRIPAAEGDASWVVYDYDHGPYAIALYGNAEDAARHAAREGYGRVARWPHGTEFRDAITQWVGR